MMMSDLGLTGNRASTLEQKSKISVFFFAFDGKEFILFVHFTFTFACTTYLMSNINLTSILILFTCNDTS
jgi:hypothetical protein